MRGPVDADRVSLRGDAADEIRVALGVKCHDEERRAYTGGAQRIENLRRARARPVVEGDGAARAAVG